MKKTLIIMACITSFMLTGCGQKTNETMLSEIYDQIEIDGVEEQVRVTADSNDNVRVKLPASQNSAITPVGLPDKFANYLAAMKKFTSENANYFFNDKDYNTVKYDKIALLAKRIVPKMTRNTWTSMIGYECLFSIQGETPKTDSEFVNVCSQFKPLGASDLEDVYHCPGTVDGKKYERMSMSSVRGGLQYIFNPDVIQVEVPLFSAITDATYGDFLDKNIVNGFYVAAINKGKYADRILLRGSLDECSNPYNKTIELIFYKGELRQMRIVIDDSLNYDGNSNQFLASYEQETVSKLLENMNCDQTEAKDFLEKFQVKGKESGNLGPVTYEHENGTYNQIIFTI